MKKEKKHNEQHGGFKVPKDYFDNFDEHMLRSAKLKAKIDDAGFKVPSGYFNSVEDRVLQAIAPAKEPKVIKLRPWKAVATAVAVAASFIIMFNAFFNTDITTDFDSLETASIETYIADEDFSSYELATLLKPNNLTTDNFINDMISEDHLEDYLLEHADLESLMFD